MRSPSSMNTQPWNFTVVSGEPLNRIRAGNTERNLAGVPHSREFRIGSAFAGQHRERQIGVAKQLLKPAPQPRCGRPDSGPGLADSAGYIPAVAIGALRRIGSVPALNAEVDYLCAHRYDHYRHHLIRDRVLIYS